LPVERGVLENEPLDGKYLGLGLSEALGDGRLEALQVFGDGRDGLLQAGGPVPRPG